MQDSMISDLKRRTAGRDMYKVLSQLEGRDITPPPRRSPPPSSSSSRNVGRFGSDDDDDDYSSNRPGQKPSSDAKPRGGSYRHYNS
jgi:hypothetical protein